MIPSVVKLIIDVKDDRPLPDTASKPGNDRAWEYLHNLFKYADAFMKYDD